MTIAKQQLLEIVRDLPDEVDLDEILYRLYLRIKLDLSEKDIRDNKLISHEEVIKETSRWFKK